MLDDLLTRFDRFFSSSQGSLFVVVVGALARLLVQTALDRQARKRAERARRHRHA